MGARALGAALAAAILLPATAASETDFTALSASERAVFHAEIRAVLMAHPELAAPRPAPPPEGSALYADDIASDLELIDSNRSALFAPGLPGFGKADARQVVALFVGPGCAACAQAESELRALSTRHDLRVTLIDATREPDLARRMTVEELPFYVLPKMMLRGHMPAAVLERYLTQETGQ